MRLFLLSALLLFSTNKSYADLDSNIYIQNSSSKIEFLLNEKTKQIKILEKSNSIYHTLFAGAKVNFFKFYDSYSKIEKVNYILDGRASFNFKPYDSFYQMQDIFYSDARVSYFDVTLPKEKSVLQIKYDKTIDNPRYFSTIYFADQYKVNTKTIEITIPIWFNAEIKEYNFNGYEISKTEVVKGDKKIITYVAKEIDAIKEEYLSAGISYTYPHLMILSKSAEGPIKETYFTDLQQQYTWYSSLILADSNANTVHNKALEITRDAKSDQDKINAVYHWIQENIRYIAFEDGIAGFQPALASEVLRKKYGDCKGMANLAKEMYKGLGFDARLSWLGTNHIAYNYSTPSLSVDNHMICTIMQQGKPLFIDPTETYLTLDNSAQRIQNREVLIENGEKYILSKNPERSVDQNLKQLNIDYQIVNNALHGKAKLSLKGESKSGFLSSYNSLKLNKTENALIDYLANDDSKYKIEIQNRTDFSQHNNNLNLDYVINYQEGILNFGTDLYIDLDHEKEFKLFTIDTRKRHSVVVFPYKYNIRHKVNMLIPEGYKLKNKPLNVDISNDDYTLKAGYTETDGVITYQKEILIKNIFVKKENIKQLNEDFAVLKDFYQETIILNKL